MDTEVVTIQLPARLYAELQALAAEGHTDPVELIDRLVTAARQHRAWLRDLTALQEQVRRDGGLRAGASKEEVVERLRQTRREIFEAEYAHLYR
jgi:IS5 family transposase